MTALVWLIPAALSLGLLGLAGFLWALRSGQFEDLDGAAYRVLDDDEREPRLIPADIKSTPANNPPPTSSAKT